LLGLDGAVGISTTPFREELLFSRLFDPTT
jgi:hypothetical protein